MFNDHDLEILDFAVRFVIANIDNELLDIMRESLKMPPEVSETELERIRTQLAERRAELKTVETALDKAKAGSKAVWPEWQSEVQEAIDKAKYAAVADLNYELAAHWRDVKEAFIQYQLHEVMMDACLRALDGVLPANTPMGKMVHCTVRGLNPETGKPFVSSSDTRKRQP